MIISCPHCRGVGSIPEKVDPRTTAEIYTPFKRENEVTADIAHSADLQVGQAYQLSFQGFVERRSDGTLAVRVANWQVMPMNSAFMASRQDYPIGMEQVLSL